ncbi:MAG: GNAT family N-acetyltransferase [Terriglobia bacterium]|jgi:RimJ/RimL family protein N-acetyltransferase|nr:GNAT family N-acetyltransferase [Terriglobia bacterium]
MRTAAKSSAVIETERLLLRQLVPEDFEAIRRIHSDPEVMAIYGGVFTEQGTRDFIQRNIDRYAKDGVGFYAITLRDAGELIGCGGIIMQPTDQGIEPEIGYQVRRDQQGRGYATEMAQGCMQYAFEVLKADHIISLIRPDNMPSRRVAEKNGLVVDREFLWREQLHLVYQMTRDEWEKRLVSAV